MVTCGQCGKEFEVHTYELGRGSGKFCSTECSDKFRSENYSGENSWFHGKKQSEEQVKKRAEAISGEKHYDWKGGRKIQGGYIRIRQAPGIYKFEHRIIAEKALGRDLKDDEAVHHVNGDKLDNRNENLLICTKGYHSWLHRRMSNLYQQEKFA